MAVLTFSLSSIVIPSPSSSSSSIPLSLSSNHSSAHLFLPTASSPKQNSSKIIFVKSHFPLLFPLSHICYSSAAVNETEESITDEFDEDQDEEEEEVEEIKGFRSIDNSRVYVGNLPYTITSKELSEIFSEAGQVKSVEIVYDRLTDRSRGFGFVIMSNIEEAKEAIRTFDGSQIGGRTVKVNFPEVPRGGERKVMGPKIRSTNQSYVDTPYKIYAGNLGWVVSTQNLRNAFADQAGFLSAKVVYDRDTGKSRGFGFVTFESDESAMAALASMNGFVRTRRTSGRPLRLNMASDRSRSNIES